MNFPRKRSQGQGGNSGSGGSNYSNNSGGSGNGGGGGQQRRQRFSGGGGQNNNSNNNGGGRTRKNYGAMREKYLAQARDALSMGDRVLAENYFQHADHCFRMLAEENASRPQQRSPQQQYQDQQAAAGLPVLAQEAAPENIPENNQEHQPEGDDSINLNVSSLPAFLTASYAPPKVEGEQVVPQNWED
jgi:hypothetical protein